MGSKSKKTPPKPVVAKGGKNAPSSAKAPIATAAKAAAAVASRGAVGATGAKPPKPSINVDDLIVSRSSRIRRPTEFYVSGDDEANSCAKLLHQPIAPAPSSPFKPRPVKKPQSPANRPAAAALAATPPAAHTTTDGSLHPDDPQTPAAFDRALSSADTAPDAPKKDSKKKKKATTSAADAAAVSKKLVFDDPGVPRGSGGNAAAAPFVPVAVPAPTLRPVVTHFITEYVTTVGVAVALAAPPASDQGVALKGFIAGVLFRDGSCATMDATSTISYFNRRRDRFTVRGVTGSVTVPARLTAKFQAIVFFRAAFNRFFTQASASLQPTVLQARPEWTVYEEDVLTVGGDALGTTSTSTDLPVLMTAFGADPGVAEGCPRFVLSRRSSPFPNRTYYDSDDDGPAC